MSGGGTGLAPLTPAQRVLIGGAALALIAAGLALWNAYGIPVALIGATLLC
ncbi:hypothetical protein ACFOMH_08015 [Paracoccus mangrovi]|uniref:Phosphatidate cytidylyltransferase n=1 Tax=Paracoccus mangrovi TaxID=1715645 RepID=A0ABV7R4P5_9RHOB